jgi:hypothetical protein
LFCRYARAALYFSRLSIVRFYAHRLTKQIHENDNICILATLRKMMMKAELRTDAKMGGNRGFSSENQT